MILIVRLYLGSLLRQSCLLLSFFLFLAEDRCVLVSRVILLPGVALAPARSHHSYLVGPGAAILALESDPLCPGPVNDATPLLSVPPAPVAPCVTPSANPVGQQLSRQTLPSTYKLLDGVDAGALAIGYVLGGPQLPAAHLALVWAWNMRSG